MRDQWGIIEAEWSWSNGFNDPFLDEFWEVDQTLLSINQEPPANLEDLQNWFTKNELFAVLIGEADADGQGQLDWLVAVKNTKGLHPNDVYMLLRQSGQLSVVRLWGVYTDQGGEKITRRWETFRPDPKAPVINVYQVGTGLYAFHLSRENGTYQETTDLNSRKISSYDSSNQIEVQDWSIKDGKLTVQYNGSDGVYEWDKSTGRLVPTGYAPDLQEENIARAERAIYFEDDPAQAIEILSHILKGRVEENYIWAAGAGITNPPRLRPYALYLLGLAYERGGDPESAARAYWQLWHDYPANPYSLAAQSKLESK